MNYAFNENPVSSSNPDIGDGLCLKQQLTREIACLRGQLARVSDRDDLAGRATVETYEDMIKSRSEVLEALGLS